MEYTYSLFEDGKTYFLKINHDKKTFSVGSAEGRVAFDDVICVDETKYKSEISKIDRDYTCLSNTLSS